MYNTNTTDLFPHKNVNPSFAYHSCQEFYISRLGKEQLLLGQTELLKYLHPKGVI